jgi:hypothetical protein
MRRVLRVQDVDAIGMIGKGEGSKGRLSNGANDVTAGCFFGPALIMIFVQDGMECFARLVGQIQSSRISGWSGIFTVTFIGVFASPPNGEIARVRLRQRRVALIGHKHHATVVAIVQFGLCTVCPRFRAWLGARFCAGLGWH